MIQFRYSSLFDVTHRPHQLYRTLIRDEESRTGEASTRPFDVSRDEALRDVAVVEKLQANLNNLIEFTEMFLSAIVGGGGGGDDLSRTFRCRVVLRCLTEFDSSHASC